MNDNNSSGFYPSVPSMLDCVMQQVDYRCFANPRNNVIHPLYWELCLIIAELLLLDPDSSVKVNGVCLITSIVQDVYNLLRHDHLRLVFDNFNNVTAHIYNKKSYLRTALYNSVFEIESHYLNEVRCY